MYCAPTAATAGAFNSEDFADEDNFDAADVPAFSYEHGGDDMSVDQVRLRSCGLTVFAALRNTPAVRHH
jgi:hypothetical protein